MFYSAPSFFITLTQFVILEAAEALSFLGFCVYLEIIILRFFKLDEDLKNNIIKRGIKETIIEEEEIDPEESNEDENEDENNNDNNEQIELKVN